MSQRYFVCALLFLSTSWTAAAARPLLWKNPGKVERLDFRYGPGGRSSVPRPPFRFLQEEQGGSTPKVRVRDASGRIYIVKWGEEASPDTFAARLVWANGYFVQPVHFVRSGKLRGASSLGRAGRYVAGDGSFRDARFKLIAPGWKYLEGQGWKWDENPFGGTRQLNGLRLLMLLLSNWDAKDGRRDSNTALFLSGRGRRAHRIYAVDDWGASLGKWGNFFSREKWDCEEYQRQSGDFIDEVTENGRVKFKFWGRYRPELTSGLEVDDVRWLMQTLGRISDRQLRQGLLASGATRLEADCFTRSLRSRILQLRRVAAASYSSKAD